MSEEVLKAYEKKKRGKRLIQVLVSVLVIALPAVYMTHVILSTKQLECEVCITYRGASKCRKASGPDKAACQQTAIDNACAFLSSGMTEFIRCSNQTPTMVRFME